MIILPILLITGGSAALIAAIASGFGEGEPAPPIELPDDLPMNQPVSTVPSQPAPQSAAQLDSNEVEALARVIASEAGSGTPAEQRAIGWTERNRALASKKSLYATFYPWRAQSGRNPPASSARDATDATRALARQILAAPQSQDPTGGATAFFEPKLQDTLAKAGVMARNGEKGLRIIDGQKFSNVERFHNYYKDAAKVRADWGSDKTIYATAGRFEFWGKKKPFLARGGQVKVIVGDGSTAGDGIGKTFKDIPDPLVVIRKLRRG